MFYHHADLMNDNVPLDFSTHQSLVNFQSKLEKDSTRLYIVSKVTLQSLHVDYL